jgi:hypothetical protein
LRYLEVFSARQTKQRYMVVALTAAGYHLRYAVTSVRASLSSGTNRGGESDWTPCFRNCVMPFTIRAVSNGEDENQQSN